MHTHPDMQSITSIKNTCTNSVTNSTWHVWQLNWFNLSRAFASLSSPMILLLLQCFQWKHRRRQRLCLCRKSHGGLNEQGDRWAGRGVEQIDRQAKHTDTATVLMHCYDPYLIMSLWHLLQNSNQLNPCSNHQKWALHTITEINLSLCQEDTEELTTSWWCLSIPLFYDNAAYHCLFFIHYLTDIFTPLLPPKWLIFPMFIILIFVVNVCKREIQCKQ